MVAENETSLDPFGAFVERATEGAVAQGPLAGLRLAVKDSIAVEELKWTAGLPLLAERRASEDAPCVAALRAAGASVVGVTATDAAGFGMMTPGVVNPLDAGLTAGGSSGGSAAAVAAGLADIALGTDTAGSVRVPAACCGHYGFKPGFGRIDTSGVTPLSVSFDHVGLMAAQLDVLTKAACVLLGEGAPQQPPAGTPVVAHDPARLQDATGEIAATVRAVLDRLRELGHEVVEIALPSADELAYAHGAVVCAEARGIWAAHWPQDAAQFGDTARRSLAYAQSVSPEDVEDAWRVIAAARGTIARAFDRADVIIGPTMIIPPPAIGTRRARIGQAEVGIVRALMSETCTYNVSGHPALAMPTPRRIGRIPVSIQLAGKDDMGLLSIAAVMEAALATLA
jgi:Asp-tRNA(Asn)/Glu-tRNA(Gln) amidotransferase A subunit family amidase